MITKLSDPANGFEICRSFSGRVGAGTQRTVQSDADAVAAVSVRGRQREVTPWRIGNDLCDSMKHRVQTLSGHDQNSNTGKQPTQNDGGTLV